RPYRGRLPCPRRRVMGGASWTTPPDLAERGRTWSFAWRYSIVTKERRLGRGLAALLGEEEPVSSATLQDHGDAQSGAGDVERFQDGQVVLLAVDQIEGNPFQPRRDFSESEIASLAESLKEHDMLQPVLVRQHHGRWQLIS